MEVEEVIWTVIIEKTDTGYSAFVNEVDGLIAVGHDISSVKLLINEVIDGYLNYLQEMGEKSPSKEQIELRYVIDLPQFFDYYKVINKTAFAEYIGLNKSLFRQYTRGLAPLSDQKLKSISEGLQRLAEDLRGVELS